MSSPTHAVFEVLILLHCGYMGGILSLNRVRRTLSSTCVASNLCTSSTTTKYCKTQHAVCLRYCDNAVVK